MIDTAAIARDLDLCDMIDAFGTRATKRKASAHRKMVFKAIKEQNTKDFPVSMTDDELLAELGV